MRLSFAPPRNRRLRQVFISMAVTFAVTVAGAAAYHFVEGWAVIESIYMVVITLSTVGYGTPRELSDAGTVITILVIILGVGSALYSLTQLAEYLLSGFLNGDLANRRNQRRISRLRSHTIICGYGRLGSELARRLDGLGESVLIIDLADPECQAARDAGLPVVQGDATDDSVLLNAGIERAKNLVPAVGSDSVNAFVVLSARALSSSLQIVARAESESSIKKLRHAGANEAITPYAAGSNAIASHLTSPLVASVVDALQDETVGPIAMKQLEVHPNSSLVGMTVGDLREHSHVALQVMALSDGQNVRLLPDGNERIEARAIIVAVGPAASLEAVRSEAGA